MDEPRPVCSSLCQRAPSPGTPQAPLIAAAAATALGGRAVCQKVLPPRPPPPPTPVAVRVERGVRPASKAARRAPFSK